jgi:hypothetical protein
VRAAPWALGEPGRDLLFYLVSTAIWVLPGVVYAVAAVLLLLGGRHRTAWSILLACGVAISAVKLITPRLLGVDFGVWFAPATFVLGTMIAPLYLSVLAAAYVVCPALRRPAWH